MTRRNWLALVRWWPRRSNNQHRELSMRSERETIEFTDLQTIEIKNGERAKGLVPRRESQRTCKNHRTVCFRLAFDFTSPRFGKPLLPRNLRVLRILPLPLNAVGSASFFVSPTRRSSSGSDCPREFPDSSSRHFFQSVQVIQNSFQYHWADYELTHVLVRTNLSPHFRHTLFPNEVFSRSTFRNLACNFQCLRSANFSLLAPHFRSRSRRTDRCSSSKQRNILQGNANR